MEAPIWGVNEQMVEQTLKSIKTGKELGPSWVTSDLIKATGATGVKWLFQVCESIEQEGEVQSSGPRTAWSPKAYLADVNGPIS